MFCPKCGQEQFCPCKACKPTHKKKLVWKWDKEGWLISCGRCGLTAYAGWWEDLSFDIFKLS